MMAIVEAGEVMSYQDLERAVLETSAYFTKKGIRKGDRILVFVPMSIDLYRIVLSLFHIGAVAVFLDEWVSKKRMEECCKIAGCRGFIGITKAHVLRFFSAELRRIPIVLKLKQRHELKRDLKIEQTDSNDTALITFTTGSTGTPKAAKRTHGFLNEQFIALREKIDPRPGDVDMSLLPIVLLINLGAGATSVITPFKARQPASFRPEVVCAEIQKHQINRITASPYFVKQLALHVKNNKVFLPSLKQVFTGGAPVFPNEAKLYREAFPGTDAQIVYGSTEAEPISSISAEDLAGYSNILKGLPVGNPYRIAEVKIVEVTDQNISVKSGNDLSFCPPNKVGEIIVAGPHVLKEYFNNEEAFKRNKIVVGEKIYHRTGDSGYLDEKGELYLTGRCSTLFNHQGKNIYPFLYENYFQNMGGISIGTVCLVGNEMVAVIEPDNSIPKEEITKRIRALEISPDKIVFEKKIPRDPRHNSKIDYAKLSFNR